ncbi:hypothetical protein CR513_13166, partial [Mucuna pruriens]
MVFMFIETLPSPFYDKAVGSIVSNIADLVTMGERIETNVVTIDPSKPYSSGGSSSSPPITLNPLRMIVSTNPSNPNRGEAANPSNIPNPKTSQPRRTFTPIPMTYTTLFHQLLQKRMITTTPPKPLEPPYPWSYDPNAKCEYQEGGLGHTTKNCCALKHRVQDFLEGGWLNFKEVGPNVSINPLPPHGGTSVNTLDHEPVAAIEQTETPFQKPLTIYYDPVRVPRAPLTISVPAQLAYRDNHAVPW